MTTTTSKLALIIALCTLGTLASQPSRAQFREQGLYPSLQLGITGGLGLIRRGYTEHESGPGYYSTTTWLEQRVEDDVPVIFAPTLSLGWMDGGAWSYGLSFQAGAGPMTVDDESFCFESDRSCTALHLRLSAWAEVRPALVSAPGVFVRVSSGYNALLFLATDADGGKWRRTHHGVDFAKLEVGYDFEAGGLRLGPYVAASAGMYLETEITGPGISEHESIRHTGVHGWIGAGVRAEFDLL